MGLKQKTRKEERLNDGDNNGQATHGARKHAWRTQATWANLRDGELDGELGLGSSCGGCVVDVSRLPFSPQICYYPQEICARYQAFSSQSAGR